MVRFCYILLTYEGIFTHDNTKSFGTLSFIFRQISCSLAKLDDIPSPNMTFFNMLLHDFLCFQLKLDLFFRGEFCLDLNKILYKKHWQIILNFLVWFYLVLFQIFWSWGAAGSGEKNYMRGILSARTVAYINTQLVE